MKLSFVPDVDLQAFQKLTAAERASINQQGYLGYKTWRSDNPDLVKKMEADARDRLTESKG
ncbi:MAG: hypothetical protein AAF198_02840 [Pseudomonadota bacterium]